MYRVLIMAAIIFVNYLLQTTLFRSIEILGAVPDTALVIIVSYAILRNDVEGAIFGFFAGLAHDLMGGYYIGLYAMLGMLTGYFSGKPFKDFFHHIHFLTFFVVLIASVGYQLFYFFIIFLFQGNINLSYYMRAIIMPKTIYTAVAAIPVYSLLYVINGRIERRELAQRGLSR